MAMVLDVIGEGRALDKGVSVFVVSKIWVGLLEGLQHVISSFKAAWVVFLQEAFGDFSNYIKSQLLIERQALLIIWAFMDHACTAATRAVKTIKFFIAQFVFRVEY